MSIGQDDAFHGRTIILGFYGSGDERAVQNYNSIRSHAIQSFHLKDDHKDTSNPLVKRYAGLRLKNEELIIAEADPSSVSRLGKDTEIGGRASRVPRARWPG